MTHCNPIAWLATETYTVALTELIKTGEPEKAFAQMENYLKLVEAGKPEVEEFKKTFL
jgi:hypothetical protein